MKLTPEQQEAFLAQLSPIERWRIERGYRSLDDVVRQKTAEMSVAPSGIAEGVEPSFIEDRLINPAKRAYANDRKALSNVLHAIGAEVDTVLTPEQEAARQAAHLQGIQRESDRAGASLEDIAGAREISEANTVGDALAAIIRNPGSVYNTVAESFFSPMQLGATVLGPAGVAASSLLKEAGGTIEETLAEEGVDVSDPVALTLALQNKELMAKAKTNALERGIPIAALDAASMGVAGRIRKLADGAGFGGRVTAELGELGAQAGAGGIGETLAQIVDKGEITSVGDIMLEMAAEMPTGSVEAAANTMRSSRKRNDLPSLAQEVNDLLPQTNDPSVNEGIETAKAIYAREAEIMEVPEVGKTSQRTIFNGLVEQEQLGDIPLSRTRKMQLWEEAGRRAGVTSDGITLEGGVPIETAEERKAREMEQGFREIEAQRAMEQQEANRSPILNRGPVIASTDPEVNRALEETRQEDPRGVLRKDVEPVSAKPVSSPPATPVATPAFSTKFPSQDAKVSLDGKPVGEVAKPQPTAPTPNASAPGVEFVTNVGTELKATTVPEPITLNPPSAPVTSSRIGEVRKKLAQTEKAKATKQQKAMTAAENAILRKLIRENPKATDDDIAKMAQAEIDALRAAPAKDKNESADEMSIDAETEQFDDLTGFIKNSKRLADRFPEDEDLRTEIKKQVMLGDKGSVKPILEAVARSKVSTPFQRAFAKKLTGVAEGLGIKIDRGVRMQGASGHQILGAYWEDENTVRLMSASPEVALHEITHAVTKTAMRSREYQNANPRAKEAVNTLKDLFTRYNLEVRRRRDHIMRRGRGDASLIGHSAKNLDEFVTMAFTDSAVQKFMASLPTEQKQTMLSKFLDAIKNLLGIGNISNSMLERVLEAGAVLMEEVQANPEAVNKARTRTSTTPDEISVGGVEVPDGKVDTTKLDEEADKIAAEWSRVNEEIRALYEERARILDMDDDRTDAYEDALTENDKKLYEKEQVLGALSARMLALQDDQLFEEGQIEGPDGKYYHYNNVSYLEVLDEDTPRSKNFTNWFGNSVVRNEDGTPKVVYHGTLADFEVFNTRSGYQQLGSHFGSTPTAANIITIANTEYLQQLAKRRPGADANITPNVMPVYIKLENPLRLRDQGSWNQTVVTQLQEQGIIDTATAKEWLQEVNQMLADDRTIGANTFLQERLRELGYDGVVYLNRYEVSAARDKTKVSTVVRDAIHMTDEEFSTKYPDAAEAYIVFSNAQVKSAVGNDGRFSRDSSVMHLDADTEVEPDTEFAPGRVKSALSLAKTRVKQMFTPTAGLGEQLKEISDHSLSLMSQYDLIGQNLFRNLQTEIEASGGAQGAGAKALRAIEETHDKKERLLKLNALKRSNPKLYQAYIDGRNQIKQLSGIILEDLKKRWPEGKRTKTQEKIIKSIIENMDTYYTRVYAANVRKAGDEWRKSLVDDFNAYRRAREKGNEKKMKQTKKNYDRVRNALNFIIENHLMIPPVDVMIEMDKDKVVALAETWGVPTDGSILEVIDALASKADSINGNKQILANRAMEEVNQLLSNDIENSSPIRMYYRGAKEDNTIISERKKVPPVLRELLGEFEDPGYRIMSTVSAQGAWIARTRMLDEIKQNGLGKWIIPASEKGKPGNEKFSRQLRGPAYGPLEGMYATVAVADMVTDNLATFYTLNQAARLADKLPTALSETVVAKMFRAYSRKALWIKATDIMTQVSNYAFNYSSGPALLASNGNTDWSTVKTAHKAMKDLIGGQYKRKLGPEALEVVRNGVVDSGYIGELQETQLDKMLEVLMQEEGDFDSWINDKIATTRKLVNQGITIGKDSYAMMDVVWKMANYFHRKDTLAKYYQAEGIKVTPEQIEREAARDTNLGNIGYKRVMPAVKVLERSGFTRFLPYMTDVFRVSIMNFVLGARDLKRAKMSSNPEAQKIMLAAGKKRLAGNTLVTAVVPMAVSALLNSYEGDDEEELKSLKGDFAKNKDLVYIGKDSKGLPIQFEVSRSDPFEPLTGLWRMGLDEGEDLDIEDFAEYALGLIISNPIGRALKEAVTNDPVAEYPRLREVYPRTYEFIAGIIEAGPGVDEIDAAKTVRFLESLVPSVAKSKSGPELADWDTVAAWTGLDLVKVNPERAARNATSEYRRTTQRTQDNFNAWVDRINNVRPDELNRVVAGLMRDEFDSFVKLREVYRGLRTYGLPEAEIKSLLGDEYARVSSGTFTLKFTTKEKLTNALNREAGRMEIKDANSPEAKALVAKYKKVKELLPQAFAEGTAELRELLED